MGKEENRDEILEVKQRKIEAAVCGFDPEKFEQERNLAITKLMEYKQKLIEEITQTPLYFVRKTLDFQHVGDIEAKVLCATFVIACYTGDVFHVMISGESSSGKSHLLEGALSFMHPDDYLKLIGATEAALKRANEILKDLKALIFMEHDATNPQSGNLEFLLRMLSAEDSGGDYLVCDKDKNDFSVAKKKLEKISIFTTYAKGLTGISNENLNRMFVIETTQSFEQVNQIKRRTLFIPKVVLAAMKKEFEFRCSVFKELASYMVDFKNLEPEGIGLQYYKMDYKIEIPYVDTLGAMFLDATLTRAPRDIKRFLTLIEVICKIHICLNRKSRQYFTTTEHNMDESIKTKWFLAEPLDFCLACELAWNETQKNMQEMTEMDIAIYNTMVNLLNVAIERKNEELQQNGWDAREITEASGKSYDYTKKRLQNLYRKSLIRPGKSSDGKKRIHKWVPVEQTFQAFKEYMDYYRLVVDDCKKAFKEHDINAEFQEIYTIYDTIDEMPPTPQLLEFGQNYDEILQVDETDLSEATKIKSSDVVLNGISKNKKEVYKIFDEIKKRITDNKGSAIDENDFIVDCEINYTIERERIEKILSELKSQGIVESRRLGMLQLSKTQNKLKS